MGCGGYLGRTKTVSTDWFGTADEVAEVQEGSLTGEVELPAYADAEQGSLQSHLGIVVAKFAYHRRPFPKGPLPVGSPERSRTDWEAETGMDSSC